MADVLVQVTKMTPAEDGALNAKIIRINRNQPAGQHFASINDYYKDMINKDIALTVTEFEQTEKYRKAFSEWYAKASPAEIIAFLSGLPGGVPNI